MTERIDLDDAFHRLSSALPEGLELLELGELERRGTSLMEAVTSCEWEILLDAPDIEPVQASVDALLAADRVIVTRERKGKPVHDDIRPDLRSLKVLMNPETATSTILAELGTEARSLRPAEFLAALEPPVRVTRVRRTHQWISHGNTRIEPHEAVASRAAHTNRCAS